LRFSTRTRPSVSPENRGARRTSPPDRSIPAKPNRPGPEGPDRPRRPKATPEPAPKSASGGHRTDPVPKDQVDCVVRRRRPDRLRRTVQRLHP
jgi:hypothetical protein